jgi:hypothetical protein
MALIKGIMLQLRTKFWVRSILINRKSKRTKMILDISLHNNKKTAGLVLYGVLKRSLTQSFEAFVYKYGALSNILLKS